MQQVTNEDLALAIEEQARRFEEHAAADHKSQQEQIAVNKEILAGQEEIKEFMKNVHVGFGALRFTFNNAAKIGAFLGLLLGIYIFFKWGLIGLATRVNTHGGL